MSESPAAAGRPPGPPGRLDNGLHADRFVPLVDLAVDTVPAVLDALRRARIAAYADPPGALGDGDGPRLGRLSVAAAERSDAAPIVASVLRTSGVPARRDPWDGLDAGTTDEAFAALVADWPVDTIAAVRAAERDLTREDAEWRARLQLPALSDEVDLEEEHYVPPPPPPLPRLALATVGALTVLVAALLVMVFGGRLGLEGELPFLLGVAGVLISAGILVMRLRERPDDEDDDGAIV